MFRAIPRLLSVLACIAQPGCAKRDAGAGTAPATAPASSSVGTASAGAHSAGSPTLEGRERAVDERRVEREELVRSLERDGIRDARVLGAMRGVPRHRFVPSSVRGSAYADRPLEIGWGQTISQPYVVAAMTEAVTPKPTDRCLEIGTGSGYQAAILSELCGRTYSIEYLPELARYARENLSALGYPVELRRGDGYRGWPEAAPFDVIVVTAAPERVPRPLLDQLRAGGRLVIPVGPEGGLQKLELWTRTKPGSDPGAFERKTLADVRFVPFLGDGGR